MFTKPHTQQKYFTNQNDLQKMLYYADKGMGQKALGIMFNCKPSTISQTCRKHGIYKSIKERETILLDKEPVEVVEEVKMYKDYLKIDKEKAGKNSIKML